MPHPTTITRLCILGKVEGTWEEEEKCPRTSPLTLTGITRPPLGKEKGKAKKLEKGKTKEIEEGDGERGEENIEQAIMVSSMKGREERQRSLSPVWNLSLEERDYHHEQAESSRQQSNNQEILGMLKRMEEGMKERENQLRQELKERDIFLDRELRKRDQFFDEMIRQRDLEWRKELEQRET